MDEPRDPIALLRAATAARDAAGLRRVLTPRASMPALADLASNDYLGLARHPQVISGAVAAACEWGSGATASRLVTGTLELHATLERALAGFTGAQAALVFSSGYLANLATITALSSALASALPPQPGPAVLVVSDERNHASIVDACRLAKARVVITGHQDAAAVERVLRHRAEPAALVVTESAFSLGGPLAPLAELHRAVRAHGALLVVDEAHALGVVGADGRGAAWDAGIATEPDVIRTVTLSKALATQGGAVLGAGEVISTLVNTGRGFIFDTGLAPPATGSALAALRLLMAEPSLASRTREHARRLADIADGLGLAVTPPSAAIVSIALGDPDLAVAAQRICAANGAWVGCFRPPSVPSGEACLRLTARANLTDGEFETVARGLTAVRDHVRTASVVGRN